MRILLTQYISILNNSRYYLEAILKIVAYVQGPRKAGLHI